MGRRIGGQEGAGAIGAIVTGVVLLVVLFVAAKLVPVKMKSSELHDFMVDQAAQAGNLEPTAIRRNILQKATDLGLPITRDQITVEKAGDRIEMSCQALVLVDLLVTNYEWRIDHQVDRPVFAM